MALWPFSPHGSSSHDQRDTGGEAFGSTTVTAAGSADTKGSWTEIIAAAAYDFDVKFIDVTFADTRQSGTDTSMLVDIGIGGSGSEVVVIPNLLAGHRHGDPYITTRVPISVAAGTRISARCQSCIASDTVLVTIDLYGGQQFTSVRTFGRATTYGVTDSGATKSTALGDDGTWVELDASIANPIRAMVLMYDMGSADDGAGDFGGDDNVVAVGIGSASSEVQLYGGGFVRSESNESIQIAHPLTGYIPMSLNIPAGTRLAARRWGGRDAGIAIIGLD